MKNRFVFRRSFVSLALAATAGLLLPGCASSLPTLVQVARARQNPEGKKNDLKADYQITDRDVLDYTNQIKLNLSHHFTTAVGARYGSSVGQTTLAALAGAASVAGWGVATASGLGQGSAFISGLGTVIDAKGDAQAYETAFVDVQKAEARFYFAQVGGRFEPDARGQARPIFPSHQPVRGIPSSEGLTPDGQALYFRVACVTKVLQDALAKKIPDLQTLKDAKGDSSPMATDGPAR